MAWSEMEPSASAAHEYLTTRGGEASGEESGEESGERADVLKMLALNGGAEEPAALNIIGGSDPADPPREHRSSY